MKTLSVSKWFYFWLYACVLCTLALLFSAVDFSSQAVKTKESATSDHWKNVTFVYSQQMNVSSDNPLLPNSCAVIKKPEQGQTAVQCQAQVKLVRPASLVTSWQQQQARDGYFIFSEPELGAVNVHAQITEVAHGVNPASVIPANPRARPVTGIFIKYAADVRQYAFRDIVTGQLSKINATPNHPFYVVNAQEYKAVGDLSQKDHLINVHDHSITLVCPAGKTRHCGRPWHAGKIIPVYNLEVYQRHRYFAGEAQILVHNVYKCKVCGEEFRRKAKFSVHIDRYHLDHGLGEYSYSGCRSQECGCVTCQIGSHYWRTHTTEKFKCENCQHEFIHYADFKQHRVTVHNDDPHFGYECPECGEIFALKGTSEQHLRERHGADSTRREGALDKLEIDYKLPTLQFENLSIHSSGATTQHEHSLERRDRSRSPL